jgi:dihydrofolate reductase
MGRVTYEAMAAHWPDSDEPHAPPMNEIPKVVFSRTLDEAPWGETRVPRGPLAEEVAALKGEPGKDVLLHGGAVITQALAREGLIDEYRMIVHPLVLGEGPPAIASRLVESRRFPAGAVALTYVPA